MDTKIDKLAEKATSWLRANISSFSVPANLAPTRALADVMVLKPVCELAITSDVLLACTSRRTRLHANALEWLAFCWRELREGNRLVEALGQCPDRLDLATIYAVFARRGMRNAEVEETLRDLCTCRGIVVLERLPWHQVELVVAFEQLGIPIPWRLTSVLQKTWLFHMPEPWSLTADAAYSVAHTVFYLTQFGLKPNALPSAQYAYLATWLPLWIERYQSQGDIDLLCELVMTSACLKIESDKGWAELLGRMQQADGMLPAPLSFRGVVEPDVQDVKRRHFLDNYHTTLVALMALVMSSKRVSTCR